MNEAIELFKTLKVYIFAICLIIFIISFLAGIIIHSTYTPPKVMTKFGFEWHLFIHFWYLWIITLVSGLGTMLCINTDW